MRITNNMIVANTKNNVNSNKINVDKYNTQMTTQKKISRASEDPVVAMRALRLATNLTHVDQYVDNNIPDALSWLDVTETALTNTKSILTDIRTQCVKGSSDTLTADDRKTILNALTQLSDQIYTEGNADYAGRTVFTGYRTNSKLTFGTDETTTEYDIKQQFSYNDISEKRYYSGSVDVPAKLDATVGDCTTKISEQAYDRLRLGYDQVSKDNLKVSYTVTDQSTGVKTTTDITPTVYESEDAWEAACGGTKTVGDNETVFIASTGELVIGKNVSASLKTDHADINVEYQKTGFNKGDVRPEYFYDCTDITDPANPIEYKQDEDGDGIKDPQQIEYTISTGINIPVNTLASDAFDPSVAQDVNELLNCVNAAINANDKVDKIKEMMKKEEYSDATSQATLKTYLDAAQKEADYADDNLQKTFGSGITRFDEHLKQVNKAITNVGSIEDRVKLTQNRVENQQETLKELKSSNEDRDLSDIIIDFYAAYNAYQSSLTAASQVGSTSLLDYLR